MYVDFAKTCRKRLFKSDIACHQHPPHGNSHQHVEITVVNNRDLIMKAFPHMVQFYQNLKSWLKNPIIRRGIRSKEGKDTLKTLDTHILP